MHRNQKTILETSDEAGKLTITLYYKGYLVITRKSWWLRRLKEVPGENPLETWKEAVARAKKIQRSDGPWIWTDVKNTKKTESFISAIPLITQIDFNKLKKSYDFNPLDDKTVSYSVTKRQSYQRRYMVRKINQMESSSVCCSFLVWHEFMAIFL